MLRIILFCLSVIVLPALAQAQGAATGTGAAPVVGGTSGIRVPPQTPLISGSQNTDVMRHRDPSGKPCLTVYGFARPQIVNPKFYDHVITATNACGQTLKMQVCYYKTDRCIAMQIPGRTQKDAILGFFPALKDFRYEFRESF